ncbi:MAG: AbrB/MazE/SpoVT family DNA-binding domain-containing protein [Coriobacteriales bacterium]|jgi:AbrB family looped-hinge helix DNA binding protein|nr:AbrB/MazE/SpoVT family DNA-binding domain-containing protein [Coriobacteriales bacterium]
MTGSKEDKKASLNRAATTGAAAGKKADAKNDSKLNASVNKNASAGANEGASVDAKADYGLGQLYGTTTVGERGQVVIPAEAREALKIHKGDKFIVFGTEKHGTLALINSDIFAKLAEHFFAQSERYINIVRESDVEKPSASHLSTSLTGTSRFDTSNSGASQSGADTSGTGQTGASNSSASRFGVGSLSASSKGKT